MIDQITGRVLRHSPTAIVVEVNGIGFQLQTSLPASAHYSKIGKEYTIPTWLLVKEDSLTLYGFLDWMEREFFETLIGVSGIGPKTAQRILSESTPEQLASLVIQGDSAGLSKIKGIGKKTADLLIVQLKGTFEKRSFSSASPLSSQRGANENEALLALISLGVKESVAQKALEKVKERLGDNLPVQDLIAEALRHT
jgi:Holliday junction DNA helicase RuvA